MCVLCKDQFRIPNICLYTTGNAILDCWRGSHGANVGKLCSAGCWESITRNNATGITALFCVIFPIAVLNSHLFNFCALIFIVEADVWECLMRNEGDLSRPLTSIYNETSFKMAYSNIWYAPVLTYVLLLDSRKSVFHFFDVFGLQSVKVKLMSDAGRTSTPHG